MPTARTHPRAERDNRERHPDPGAARYRRRRRRRTTATAPNATHQLRPRIGPEIVVFAPCRHLCHACNYETLADLDELHRTYATGLTPPHIDRLEGNWCKLCPTPRPQAHVRRPVTALLDDTGHGPPLAALRAITKNPPAAAAIAAALLSAGTPAATAAALTTSDGARRHLRLTITSPGITAALHQHPGRRHPGNTPARTHRENCTLRRNLREPAPRGTSATAFGILMMEDCLQGPPGCGAPLGRAESS